MAASEIVTLTIVVFCTSIIAFFSQELIGLYKKIMRTPGATLLAPLIVASWLIEVFEFWGRWLLLGVQAKFEYILTKIDSIIPFETGSMLLTRIVFLCVLACLPLWFSQLKRQRKESLESISFMYRLSLIVWIVTTVLLILPH